MVTEFLLHTLTGVLLGFIELTPTAPVDYSAVKAQSVQVGAIGSGLNGYTPIGQLGMALGLLVLLRLALLAWQGVLFIYHQFWGSS